MLHLTPRLSRCPQVLLEAIRNILRSGQNRLDAAGNNPYLLAFEQCGGIDAVELLQVCFFVIRSARHMLAAHCPALQFVAFDRRRRLHRCCFFLGCV